MTTNPTDATVIPLSRARRKTASETPRETASLPLGPLAIDPGVALFEVPQAPAGRRRAIVAEPVVPRESTKPRSKPRPKRVDPVIHQAVDAALEHLGRLDSETMTETEKTLAAAVRQLAVAVMHGAIEGGEQSACLTP